MCAKSRQSVGSDLFEAAKQDVAKCIAKYTPLAAGQILYVINRAKSIDKAIAAIDYGLRLNVDPTEAFQFFSDKNKESKHEA